MIQNLLPHLYYFWKTAQKLHFTEAANELRISQSAISFQIRQLENKLGRQLFFRKARQPVSLTPDGKRLAEQCQHLFKFTAEMLSALENDSFSGYFCISVASHFGATIMVPFSRELKKKYPKLDLDLHLSDEVMDLFKEPIDMSIRWRPKSRDDRLQFEAVMQEHYVIVASPKYIKSAPPLKHPMDLVRHDLITRHATDGDWKLWLDLLPPTCRPPIKGKWVISSSFGMIEATLSGMGIIIMARHAVEKEIQSKKMVPLLEEWPIPSSPYYAVYPKSPFPLPKQKMIISELRQYLKRHYSSKAFEEVKKDA